MARPAQYLSPDAEAMWEALCARWQSGETTVDELISQLGLSRATIYRRLQDAQQRIELRVLDANQAAFEAKTRPDLQTLPSEDRSRPSIDDGTYLCLTDDPLGGTWLGRDYSRDDVHGEPCMLHRPVYLMATLPAHEQAKDASGRPLYDVSSLDAQGGRVLVGGGAIRYDGAGAGRNRLPSPPLEGQRLRLNRLGTGTHVKDVGGPTRHQESEDGLSGGVGTAVAAASEKRWTIACPDVEAFTVEAKNERAAKRRAKERLKIALKDPLPAGTRIGREA